MPVGQRYDNDMLACGLRALGAMARHGPMAVDDIARLSGASSRQALVLLDTLVQCGYAARFADTSSYVLTALAQPLVPPFPDFDPSIGVH